MNTNNQLQKKPSFFILFLTMSFGSMGALIATPALPMISHFFAVSASAGQQLISVYLIGYAVGQLFYGPIANRYGRKVAFYLGISIEIIGALFCVFAGLIHVFALLIVGRLLMAAGACVGLGMTLTIVYDFFDQDAARILVSYLLLAFAVIPGISTTVGGFLVSYFSWESSFYFMVLYGILLLGCVFYLPETAKNYDQHALKFCKIFKSYTALFTNRQLMLYGLIVGGSTACIYLFSASAPFIGMHLVKLTPEKYGLFNLIPSIGLFLGSLLSANMAKKISVNNAILLGIAVDSLGAFLMFIAFAQHIYNTLSLFLPITLIMFGNALILPNGMANATKNITDISGATSIASFINLATAVTAVFAASALGESALILPIFLMLGCLLMFILLSVASSYKLLRQNSRPAAKLCVSHLRN